MSALLLDEITVRYGSLIALDYVTLRMAEGEITSIVGPNGAGKSTLLGVASGALAPRHGVVSLGESKIAGAPHRFARAGIRRTFQTPRVMPAETLLFNVLVGISASNRSSLLGDLFDTYQRGKAAQRDAKEAQIALERMGLGHLKDVPAGSLSYGQVRLLELARAFVGGPRFLLLDEPAAGLNDDETELLGRQLQELAVGNGLGVVLVEHNLKLVTSISSMVHVLNFGQLIASGPPDEIVRNEAVIEAYTGGASS
ncbi:MAG: ABC transporter ATP-binding protein [Roseovarius sp.]|jgi:ABC-type branched-subunit amino acid transport system ATPase component|nr:ABC transporter ATP-binding protein [Roseovarius sp.]